MTPQERFNSNQKLVSFTMLKYFKTWTAFYEDLKSEGYLGLWQACLKYDESLGTKFSTFAVNQIWCAMTKFLRERSTVIRIPRDLYGTDEGRCLFNVPSLDAEITDESDTQFHEVVPYYEDFTDATTEASIEAFLRTITNQRDRDIFEEYIYGVMYFEAPNQADLAEKYKVTQPAVARILKKYKQRFQKFLER